MCVQHVSLQRYCGPFAFLTGGACFRKLPFSLNSALGNKLCSSFFVHLAKITFNLKKETCFSCSIFRLHMASSSVRVDTYLENVHQVKKKCLD